MNICEVDVFEDYPSCNQPGNVTYTDDETGDILLCVNHATEIARSRT